MNVLCDTEKRKTVFDSPGAVGLDSVSHTHGIK